VGRREGWVVDGWMVGKRKKRGLGKEEGSTVFTLTPRARRNCVAGVAASSTVGGTINNRLPNQPTTRLLPPSVG